MAPHAPLPLSRYPVFRSAADALSGGIGPERPVALVGRILSVSSPDPRGTRVAYTLKLRDLRADIEVTSAPIYDLPLVADAREALRAGLIVVAYGVFLGGDSAYLIDPEADLDDPDERPKLRGPRLRLQLHHLRRAHSPTLLCLRSAEALASIDQQIDQLLAQGEGAIAAHLLSEFHQTHGIVTTALSPRFQLGERMTLVQALSGGMVRAGVNDRLSALFVSPPGAGKKVLADLACFLAPVSEVVQPGLMTPAGLAARVEYRDGWTASPGALPRIVPGTETYGSWAPWTQTNMPAAFAQYGTGTEKGFDQPARVQWFIPPYQELTAGAEAQLPDIAGPRDGNGRDGRDLVFAAAVGAGGGAIAGLVEHEVDFSEGEAGHLDPEVEIDQRLELLVFLLRLRPGKADDGLHAVDLLHAAGRAIETCLQAIGEIVRILPHALDIGMHGKDRLGMLRGEIAPAIR